MVKRPNQLHHATIAARAGGSVDPVSGGVIPPLQPATTFARDRDYNPINPDNIYGRDSNDAVRLAESILADLEGAAAALLFPSGMAAIAAVVRTLQAGDRLLLQTGIYWGTTKWVREFCSRRGIALHECDATDPPRLAQDISSFKPSMVCVETPSNPWLGTVDLKAASSACRAVGAALVVDSTAATPILSQPIQFGADFVIHAATKAINGHSDVLAGVVACRDDSLARWTAIATDRHDAGAIIGGFEAWLLIRSLRTLPLRIERMSENALSVAEFLDGHDRVEAVLYPGLPSHAGHGIAAEQMQGGFGGLLSFLCKGDGARALQICGRLKLFHRATSLGGVESLVEHRHTVEGGDTGIPVNLIRLSIGIEHVDDLIDDLENALLA